MSKNLARAWPRRVEMMVSTEGQLDVYLIIGN